MSRPNSRLTGRCASAENACCGAATCQDRVPASLSVPGTTGPAWSALGVLTAALLCTGAGAAVTDTMPACASGWRPALPSRAAPEAYRYDVEVTVDATLVVRDPGDRVVAVLHKGDRRAWTCPEQSRKPDLSS